MNVLRNRNSVQSSEMMTPSPNCSQLVIHEFHDAVAVYHTRPSFTHCAMVDKRTSVRTSPKCACPCHSRRLA